MLYRKALKNPLYYWSQVRGMPVVTAPRVLRFRLVMKDEEGAESFPAYVNVTVAP
jgi:hypothetical protein